MSIEFGLGDAPPVPVPSLDLPGADDASASETPAGPAPELVALSETFGGDFTGFTSVEDAQRAALLIAQSYAQAGNVAPRQAPQPPANTQTSTNAPPAPEVEEDYGDLDPKVVARLKQLDRDLKTTRAESKQMQERLAHEQYLLQQQQNQDVLNRAIAAIDALADPRYGVGGNRSYTQDLARENLLRTADRILNGMHGAGKNPPTIEKLISMAVLAESGKLPATKGAESKGSGGAAPPARVGGGNVPQVPTIPKRKTGTEIDTYTADKEFMDGARAIVNRGRR